MKNDKDFEEFVKTTPYSVPDDFFENVTIKTLGKAKANARKLKVRRMVISVSVAATFFIMVSIGYAVLKSNQLNQEIEIAQNIQPEKQEIGSQMDEIFTNETEEIMPDNIGTEFQTETSEPTETIEDLFTQMDEEELRELASILTNELFFDDLTIELR